MPPHILVAEDDTAMRSMIADALRRDGCVVSEAANGAELLFWIGELLARDSGRWVDLIVADVRMPWGSGLEALRTLRRHEGTTPVILMTAFGDDATHDEAQRLGAANVFDKPFALDDLCTAVRYYSGAARP